MVKKITECESFYAYIVSGDLHEEDIFYTVAQLFHYINFQRENTINVNLLQGPDFAHFH
jgi:hypothetical protein